MATDKQVVLFCACDGLSESEIHPKFACSEQDISDLKKNKKYIYIIWLLQMIYF